MTQDENSWAAHVVSRPFEAAGLLFRDYAPAFRLGYSRFREDTLFEDVSNRLADEWDEVRGQSRLAWPDARHAVRAAWERASVRRVRAAG